MTFRHYIALGDSMSIDLYPALDAGETDVAVALEWDQRAGGVAPLGAASLLYRNADDRYPEFEGRDLVSRYADIDFLNLAEDGATIGDVFGSQIPLVGESGDDTLITLSVGGNDLLSAFANMPSPALLKQIAHDVGEAYEVLVQTLLRSRPKCAMVLTTIYDPSDETRRIPGVFDDEGPLPLESLHDLNDRIRRTAAVGRRCVVADAHSHFLGHGVTAPEGDRWYWRRSWVEPNAAGASEIRGLWLDAVDALTEN